MRLQFFSEHNVDNTATTEHSAGQAASASNSEAPKEPISLPVLTGDELRECPVEWNDTAVDYPRDKCLHDFVERQAVERPDSVAAIYGRKQMSYADLNARANQLAHYLRKRGVGRDVCVGVCLKRSLEFAVACLAILKAGGACVPLDPEYPSERLAFMLQDIGAPIVLTNPGLLTAVPACASTLFVSESAQLWLAEPSTAPPSGVLPSDTAYVLYTSGSTGTPRGVMLTHQGLVNYNFAVCGIYDLYPGDRMLQFCSISFDIAIEEVFATWMSGATVVFRTEDMSLVVADFVKWIDEQRITVVDLPTAYWHEWVYALPELRMKTPPGVRLVVVGGEKASAKAYRIWRKLVGNRVRWINSYGPTETSISATIYEPRTEDEDSVPEIVPIGRPLPNMRAYVLDPDLNQVPVGVTGELHIGGDGVARGYLNRPELTATKFIPDRFSEEPGARLYKTGDLVRYLPSGDLEFLGRIDHQVKIRGFRIELEEIEAVLAKNARVRETAVTVQEDTTGNKRLVAFIVRDQSSDSSATDLKEYAKQHLPPYMVPAEVVFLEAMPLTPNGKIDRRALPLRKQVQFEQPTSSVGGDPLHKALLEIWEDVLGRKPIGIRDDFFELGGHSLLAARLMHRIGQLQGKNLPLATLVEAPTIEQLATVLRQNRWARHWSSLVPMQPEGCKQPFFCVHGVGGNVVGFQELARHMKPQHPFYGLQSQGLDGICPCHSRIEEMAAHYIYELRGVRPHGPYLLGGFSFGGLVAYEMAQQLRAASDEVALLVLFDTYVGNLKPANTSLLHLLHRPSPRQMRLVPRALQKKVRRTVHRWLLPEVLKRVGMANAEAAKCYDPKPYAGKVTLLRATTTWRPAENTHAGWSQLAQQLEVVDVPGDHMEILHEPQVSRVAEVLKHCIDSTA